MLFEKAEKSGAPTQEVPVALGVLPVFCLFCRWLLLTYCIASVSPGNLRFMSFFPLSAVDSESSSQKQHRLALCRRAVTHQT